MREKIKTLSQSILGIQKKRWNYLVIGFVVLAILVWGLGQVFRGRSTQIQEDKLVLHDVSRDIDDPAAWYIRNESKIREQGNEQQKLKSDLQKLQDSSSSKKTESQLKVQLEEQNKKLAELSDRLNALSERKPQVVSQTQKFASSKSEAAQADQGSYGTPVENLNPYDLYPSKGYYQNGRANKALFGSTSAPNQAQQQPNQTVDNGLLDVQFSVGSGLEATEKPKNIDSYIPANTLVEAVLLSGLDASAGVDAQGKPQPVVLRVTNFANFPNKMRGQLKSCRVGAQAWGEISSERAYIRPDTLSCVKQDGTVLETNVKGFVAGSDGKAGVRGKVIMRDGPMLTRSFFGGLLSGLGKGTSSALGTTSVSPLGSTTSTQGADILKSAGAEGVGNAFDMIAKYHIKRANQYHPIIQISAGQSVDIVFNAGAWLGEYAPPKDKTEKNELSSNPVKDILGGNTDD